MDLIIRSAASLFNVLIQAGDGERIKKSRIEVSKALLEKVYPKQLIEPFYEKAIYATRQWRYSVLSRKNVHALATPKWSNYEAITTIYKQAALISVKTGKKHHVDHIVPLNGKIVCGLHWEYNLQILPAKENLRKGNKHDT